MPVTAWVIKVRVDGWGMQYERGKLFTGLDAGEDPDDTLDLVSLPEGEHQRGAEHCLVLGAWGLGLGPGAWGLAGGLGPGGLGAWI